ncbi:MAG TPA: GNAT family N-acetyltransferase [Acidimicrobiales bacterium]|nr:GNAT family N-acetyltransferase [Acidimicrobiales bacterium]
MQVAPRTGGGEGSDVLLADGTTAHIRPLVPGDGPAVVDLHGRLSQESVWLRYFSSRPILSDGEIGLLTRTGDPDHVALAAERNDRLIGIAQYDREPGSDEAEVAFVVEDAFQGKGLGTLLLEQLASIGRRHGISRFVALTLAVNRQMLSVFLNAGFAHRTTRDHEVLRVVMDIAPTSEAIAALEERDRRAVVRSVERILRPRSVAVLGASRRPGTIGHELVRNLVRGGFEGPVFPVNPRASHVASLPCWPSIDAVPGEVDLAVVAVPAAAVEGAVDACGNRHVGGLVIVSSGFAETGPAGTEAERALTRLAHRHGMRIVGPNCFGVLNTDPGTSMNATFAPDPPTAGRFGFVSQSGGLGIAILAEARQRGFGLSSFVSMGNKADVSGNDLLAWWEQDERTDVVLLYLESFGNPRKFARLARRIGRVKPIVTVKGGRSAVGRRAASSHTAALASPEEAVEAMCHQTGVVRVDTIEELFDVAQVLGGQPLAAGPRVAVLSNSGGPGVLAVDAAGSNGLSVPVLSDSVQQALTGVVPKAGGVANPVDLGAGASSEAYRRCLGILLRSDEVDCVLAIFTPPLVTRTDDVRQAIAAAVDDAAADGIDRPVVVSLLGAHQQGATLQASSRPVPVFTYPETAIRALGHAVRYGSWRQRPLGTIPQLDGLDANEGRERLARVPRDGGWLIGAGAMDLLRSYGIPTLPTVEIGSAAEAASAAEEMGCPVALKVLGTGILHKSDRGGVLLDLRTPGAVSAGYSSLVERIGPDMSGAIVQPMAPDGLEVIVGAVSDPDFGPQVLFGLGGVDVELLGDHCLRLAPLTDVDVGEMLGGLRGSPLLTGWRGSPPVDSDALAEVLHRVGRLMVDLPEVVELDCNPVVATSSGAVVVDARARVSTDHLPLPLDSRHLR